MYFNPVSRRYFLRGLGMSLALPFLPSVMSRAYAAGNQPPCFVQLLAGYGVFGSQYFTADTNLTLQGSSGVYAKALASVTGDFSKIIGANFNPYRSKMSIVRGLHLPATYTNHSTSSASCGSGRRYDNSPDGERSEPAFPYSVDTVISESSKTYAALSPAMQRHVNFCPNTESRYNNFSWNKKDGTAQRMANTSTTSALLGKFAPLKGGTPPHLRL